MGKILTKTSRTVGYLEKLFRGLNDRFYDGKLPEPVIQIIPDLKTYGHISVGKIWKREDGQHAYELNISSYHLDRPIENVCSTILHEMAHEYALENGIQDTSRNGYYHNKKFKEIAENHGIIVDYDNTIGWSRTSPSDALIEWLLENDYTSIEFYKEKPFAFALPTNTTITVDTNNTGITVNVTPKSSTRKYQCPKCGNSFRATKDINVLCIDCQIPFVKQI